MRSPFGFIKTAKRGSAYSTRDGQFWLIKVQGAWHLIQPGSTQENRERRLVGIFPTMTAAADYYQREMKA